uniref:Uncharacterized protein n=1 Tax=Arundo donax TaxID=35708 RepID=A0A0A8YKQ2_ARUDO
MSYSIWSLFPFPLKITLGKIFLLIVLSTSCKDKNH